MIEKGSGRMTGEGILAIWNDCKPGHHDAYEAWYQGEHLIERLGIPGFLRGRRYQSIDAAGPAFFTYYETLKPDVLATPAYQSRIDNPTSETARIMSSILINMSRTVCRVVERVGRMRGGVALTVRLAPPAPVVDLFSSLMDDSAIARAEFWEAIEGGGLPASREEGLRGGDDKIAACLFVETLREEAAQKVLEDLRTRLSGMVEEVGIYRLLCELTPETSS